MKQATHNLPDGTLATVYYCENCKILHGVMGETHMLQIRWSPLNGLQLVSSGAEIKNHLRLYKSSFPALVDFCAAYWSDWRRSGAG